MIGDRLFALSPRDVQARYLSPFFRRVAPAGVAAASIDVTLTVPIDFNLILQSSLIEIISGAAQTLTFTFLFAGMSPPALFLLDGWPEDGVIGVAGREQFIQTSFSDLLIPPGTILTARATWSAGAAANFVGLNIAGMMIPVGNVERT